MEHDAQSADALVKENAELRADRALIRAYLSEARSELKDARARCADANTAQALTHVELREAQASSAALVEACEALAAFIEAYTPDSPLARQQPTFYSIFRVYGKNARAAAAAVRPQADALLAELAAARAALDQIDRHIVGACESPMGGLPEPCEECGEMREIAHQALQAMKEMRSG